MPAPPFRIIKASELQIPCLAARLRACDTAEVMASSALNPYEALRQSLALSTRAWSALTADGPVAMWGVGAARGALSSTGSPWFLATDGIYALRRAWLRLSRRYIAIMHEDFPVLENYVRAENRASIRWLAWCGFDLAERPVPYGPAGEQFYKFRRTQCAT